MQSLFGSILIFSFVIDILVLFGKRWKSSFIVLLIFYSIAVRRDITLMCNFNQIGILNKTRLNTIPLYYDTLYNNYCVL